MRKSWSFAELQKHINNHIGLYAPFVPPTPPSTPLTLSPNSSMDSNVDLFFPSLTQRFNEWEGLQQQQSLQRSQSFNIPPQQQSFSFGWNILLAAKDPSLQPILTDLFSQLKLFVQIRLCVSVASIVPTAQQLHSNNNLDMVLVQPQVIMEDVEIVQKLKNIGSSFPVVAIQSSPTAIIHWGVDDWITGPGNGYQLKKDDLLALITKWRIRKNKSSENLINQQSKQQLQPQIQQVSQFGQSVGGSSAMQIEDAEKILSLVKTIKSLQNQLKTGEQCRKINDNNSSNTENNIITSINDQNNSQMRSQAEADSQVTLDSTDEPQSISCQGNIIKSVNNQNVLEMGRWSEGTDSTLDNHDNSTTGISMNVSTSSDEVGSQLEAADSSSTNIFAMREPQLRRQSVTTGVFMEEQGQGQGQIEKNSQNQIIISGNFEQKKEILEQKLNLGQNYIRESDSAENSDSGDLINKFIGQMFEIDQNQVEISDTSENLEQLREIYEQKFNEGMENHSLSKDIVANQEGENQNNNDFAEKINTRENSTTRQKPTNLDSQKQAIKNNSQQQQQQNYQIQQKQQEQQQKQNFQQTQQHQKYSQIQENSQQKQRQNQQQQLQEKLNSQQKQQQKQQLKNQQQQQQQQESSQKVQIQNIQQQQQQSQKQGNTQQIQQNNLQIQQYKQLQNNQQNQQQLQKQQNSQQIQIQNIQYQQQQSQNEKPSVVQSISQESEKKQQQQQKQISSNLNSQNLEQKSDQSSQFNKNDKSSGPHIQKKQNLKNKVVKIENQLKNIMNSQLSQGDSTNQLIKSVKFNNYNNSDNNIAYEVYQAIQQQQQPNLLTAPFSNINYDQNNSNYLYFRSKSDSLLNFPNKYQNFPKNNNNNNNVYNKHEEKIKSVKQKTVEIKESNNDLKQSDSLLDFPNKNLQIKEKKVEKQKGGKFKERQKITKVFSDDRNLVEENEDDESYVGDSERSHISEFKIERKQKENQDGIKRCDLCRVSQGVDRSTKRTLGMKLSSYAVWEIEDEWDLSDLEC